MTTFRPYLFELATALAAASLSAACENSTPGEEAPAFSREALMDPKTCRPCHRDHYDEWSQSMHAYAANDPVFLAMNRRGQEETAGALGDFCVRCHAPMAVLEGRTSDGLELESLDLHRRLLPELEGAAQGLEGQSEG